MMIDWRCVGFPVRFMTRDRVSKHPVTQSHQLSAPGFHCFWIAGRGTQTAARTGDGYQPFTRRLSKLTLSI